MLWEIFERITFGYDNSRQISEELLGGRSSAQRRRR